MIFTFVCLIRGEAESLTGCVWHCIQTFTAGHQASSLSGKLQLIIASTISIFLGVMDISVGHKQASLNLT